MIHYKYACRTCRRKALFSDEEKAMRWWLKHDGHDRSAKLVTDEPVPKPLRPRLKAPSMSPGVLAFCPSCRTGEHMKNFNDEYDAWSEKHRRCR